MDLEKSTQNIMFTGLYMLQKLGEEGLKLSKQGLAYHQKRGTMPRPSLLQGRAKFYSFEDYNKIKEVLKKNRNK